MIYVDIETLNNRISIDDNKAINIKIFDADEPEDYGDEDVTKMVTTVHACDITITPAIADTFKDVKIIKELRWNYYMPCYYISGNNQVKEVKDDGSIIYHVTK